MTVGELQAEVAYLGFETRLNDEAIRRGFIPALNRGIAELDALSPRCARVVFYHRPPLDLLPAFSPIRKSPGEIVSISIPDSARAFSARVSGKGVLTLRDGNGDVDFLFSTGRRTATFCRTVSGAGTLLVTDGEGGGGCDILSVRAFDSDAADGLFDESGYLSYRVRDERPDFFAFEAPFVEYRGAPYTGEYKTSDDALLLPANAPAGEYTAVVRLSPQTVSEDDGPSALIPLGPAAAALLPELVASFLWLDDAPEKARFYYEVYLRKYAALRASFRRFDGDLAVRGNGW